MYKIMSGEEVPQKKFWYHITSIIIRLSHPWPLSASRPGHTFKVPDEIRLDRKGYYPNLWPVRRCVICKKNCQNLCKKYNISVHVNTCFKCFMRTEKLKKRNPVKSWTSNYDFGLLSCSQKSVTLNVTSFMGVLTMQHHIKFCIISTTDLGIK